MALTQITTDGIKDGTITGTDLATNVDLVDNQKLRLGTGNDLEIYHDGVNRIVGSGNLLFQSPDIFFKSLDGNTTYASINSSGNVGIGITSIASSTRLALSESSGNAQTLEIIAANNSGVGSQPGIKFTNSSGGNTGGIFADTNSGEVRLQTGGTPRLVIDSSGDVTVKTGHLNLENATATNSRHFSITNASGSTGWTFGNGVTASAHQFVIYDNTAGAARMLINSSGFVGIGQNNPDSPLEVVGTGPSLTTIWKSNGATNDEARIMLGALSSFQPDQRGAGIAAVNNGAGHDLIIKCSPSHGGGPAEKVRVTSAGAVGIKTNSPIGTLDVHDGSLVLSKPNSSGNERNWRFLNNNAAAGNLGLQVSTAAGGSTFSNVVEINSAGLIAVNTTDPDNFLLNLERNTQVLKVDHNAVGDTTGIIMRHARGGLSGYSGKMISFVGNQSTEKGSIVIGTHATGFNTSSDYRLKENEVAISDGITRLKQLKPYIFNFKEDPDVKVDGFFAHEVSSVVPIAVTGTKDAVVTQAMIDNKEYGKETLNDPIYQGIDQSKLVPLLTAALQEAIVRIEVLEAG